MISATCMCGNDLWPDAPMESSKTGQIRKASVGWLCAGRIVTTLLVIAWSVLSAAPTWAADDTEQVVLTAHERRRAATLAGDVAALDSMMTDDLTFMHANAAVETKAEFLDALKTGRYKYQSLTDEEHRVRARPRRHRDRLGDVSHPCDRVREGHRHSCRLHRTLGEGARSLADGPLAGDPSALAKHQLCKQPKIHSKSTARPWTVEDLLSRD